MKLRQIIEDNNINSIQPMGINSWSGAKMAQDAMDPSLYNPENEPTSSTLASPGTELPETAVGDTEQEQDTVAWMIPTYKDPTVK